MSEFLDLETQDGIRMTWNVIPGTKQDATNCVVPVSAIYTPLKPNPSILFFLMPLSVVACAVRFSTLSQLLILLQRFGSVRSAFSATISHNITTLFQKTTSLLSCFLNIPPLSTNPLLKRVLWLLQSSSLLLIHV